MAQTTRLSYRWGLHRCTNLLIKLDCEELNGSGTLTVSGNRQYTNWVLSRLRLGKNRYGHPLGRFPNAQDVEDVLYSKIPGGLGHMKPYRSSPHRLKPVPPIPDGLAT